VARGKKSGTGRLSQLYLLLGAITVLLVIALLLLPGMVEKSEDKPAIDERPAEITKPPEDAAVLPDKVVKVPPKRGAVALVIDDAGHNIHELLPLLKFPGPLTLAVLPGLEYSTDALKAIKAAGKDSILHQPMEALGGNDPGPDAVYTWMDEKTIRAQITKNIDNLAGVRGINNHMGSKATSDPRVMNIVLSELKSRKMFFLDSRTSADTVGRKVAADMQLPFLERSVFLDNTQEKEAIMHAFREGLKIAEKEGSVVMIGHVWTHELADVLLEVYPQALDEGFEFLSVMDLLDEVD
jgi:polysaccharide deacetylase 2 family uncharacterized protein YibQ